jgi:predicted Ser/Thr protein kinase
MREVARQPQDPRVPSKGFVPPEMMASVESDCCRQFKCGIEMSHPCVLLSSKRTAVTLEKDDNARLASTSGYPWGKRYSVGRSGRYLSVVRKISDAFCVAKETNNLLSPSEKATITILRINDMEIQKCPTNDELVCFDAGRLHSSRFEEISEHLDRCDDCAARFESLGDCEDELLDSLRKEFPCEIIENQSDIEGLLEGIAAAGNTSKYSVDDTRHGDETRAPRRAEFIASILSPPESDDEIGRLDRYRVFDVLGVGGMGVVFLAEDTDLKRKVAVKAMLPRIAASSPLARERFLLEAQATARIKHDNVVTIYQVGGDHDIPFFAMEFLEGQSLAELIARKKRLTSEHSLQIIRQIANGLSAAHQCGIIHRDIKPANIWLQETPERVKILDFGLARSIDGDANLTHDGAVVGTPNYLSPEQASGNSIDARSDLFSLGVVLYEMLTAVRPFERPNVMAIFRAIGITDGTLARLLMTEMG